MANQPTLIRHATRNKSGHPPQIAVVITVTTGGPLAVFFQQYRIANNGAAVLITEASYATEPAALDRWERWLNS